jgi:hypothetical protein
MVGFAGSLAAQVGKQIASPAEVMTREAWRRTMHLTPAPREGCFHASYPATEWQEVQCAPRNGWRSALPRNHGDEKGGHRNVFGPGLIPHNNDIAVQAPSGHLLSSVLGSFSASGVTSETGVGVAAYGGGGILGPNEYSLQLNTNDNYTAACGYSSGCAAWVQFAMATNTPVSAACRGNCPVTNETQVFVEYWLLNWGTDFHDGANICPAGFNDAGMDQLGGAGDDCFQNSQPMTIVKGQLPITDLADLELSGSATAGGMDTAKVIYNGQASMSAVKDSYTEIASVWNQAEFNVVGDANGSEAEFNNGTFLTAHISVTDGSTTQPTCVTNGGTTGESNNLNFVPSTSSPVCCAYGGSNPRIEFAEVFDSSHTYSASCSPSRIVSCDNGFTASNGECICPAPSHSVAGKCFATGQCPVGNIFDPLLKKCVKVFQEPPPPNE